MPDDDWWQALWPDPKAVLARAGIMPGMTVVDLCCGNGHFTVPLALLVGRQGKVHGVDMDADMLATARSRLDQVADKTQASDCQWTEADACKLDQAFQGKAVCDALIIANTFHGVPDQIALSASVAKVLKALGLYIIINWHARPREETIVLDQPRGPKTDLRMCPDDVVAVVVPAGFTLREIIELPPYHYGAVFQVA